MRTEGDFNLHSDSNINMHAGGQIRMSSAGEMIQSADLHDEPRREGHIQQLTVRVGQGLRQGWHKSSFTDGTQLHGASGQIHLAGAQVHFNSTGASPTWGPKWLDTDAAGMHGKARGRCRAGKKGIKPLEPFTRQTKTTVHRFVTHEPMFRANVIASDGIIPSGRDLDKKQWIQVGQHTRNA